MHHNEINNPAWWNTSFNVHSVILNLTNHSQTLQYAMVVYYSCTVFFFIASQAYHVIAKLSCENNSMSSQHTDRIILQHLALYSIVSGSKSQPEGKQHRNDMRCSSFNTCAVRAHAKLRDRGSNFLLRNLHGPSELAVPHHVQSRRPTFSLRCPEFNPHTT